MSTLATAWPESHSVAKTQAPPKADSRLAMFDATRLIAAYAIVWLHTPKSPELIRTSLLGRFAVPFFVCATVYFIWQSLVGPVGSVERPSRPFVGYAKSRFTRIYVPFLAWSVIYLAFKAVKGLALPDQPNEFPGLEFLWAGSFYHLWFMPFIFVVSLAVFALGKLLVTRPRLELFAGAASAIAGVGLALVSAPSWLAGSDLEFAFNALPSVFWGLAFSIACHRGAARYVRTGAAAGLGLAALVSLMFWVYQSGRNNLAENAAGVACILVALAPWKSPAVVELAKFGPLAYGIYLSHLLFIKTAEAAAARLGAHPSWQLDITVFLIAATLSTLLAAWLRRSKKTSWLVG